MNGEHVSQHPAEIHQDHILPSTTLHLLPLDLLQQVRMENQMKE